MKANFRIICVFILSLSFLNCENTETSEATIGGKWNVTQIIGGFSQPKNYDSGTFTWEFNKTTKKVTIINTADVFPANQVPSFINNQGGTYSFEILEENNSSFLVVENRKGEIKLEQNKLTIDYGIAYDDIGYILER